MGTENQPAASPSETVTVPRSVLRQLVSLADSLEAADAAYKSCQASLFRAFAQSVYKAPNVQRAVEQAREALRK